MDLTLIESGNQIEKIDVYQSAHPLSRAAPNYPRDMRRQSRDGWVDFNFMVNTAGEPYEVEVADHSYGGEDFINAARNAIEKYEYQPATLDGQPVDSSNSIRIRFEMTRPLLGVSRSFKKNMKSFVLQ